MSEPAQLTDAIAALQPGAHVTLTVSHSGTSRTVTVTLGNAPAKP
jgi:S1-C subfamily serine protease